jgi:hypothetical protein
MALTNAKKQKRWRDKRNALARLAEQLSRIPYDYLLAGAVAGLACLISPWGIRLLFGRIDLGPRITIVSICLDLFLVSIIGALLTRNWLRQFFFWSMLILFPFALVSGLEGGAQAIHLADRVAPLVDKSILRNQARYPGYLRSGLSSIAREKDGVRDGDPPFARQLRRRRCSAQAKGELIATPLPCHGR